MSEYHAIQWMGHKLRLLDQRRLPLEVVYLDYEDHREVADAIREMVVRGAPAIGITAGYALVLAAYQSQALDAIGFRADLEAAAAVVRAARPTASNLFYAVARVMKRIADPELDRVSTLRDAVLEEAHAIFEAECQANLAIGRNSLPLIPDVATFIHHCNTGPLATGEYGTALRVISAAYEAGKRVHVYVDETRPRLQGARLTAWELKQMGIPHTVIVDGAAAHIMRTRGVDLCVVGCDRIAANGDTANKIGTYSLALAAHIHGVPFYVVGPTSTIDMDVPNGDAIEIEERSAVEVTHVRSCQVTPDDTEVANPAFDVTPAQYITAIITERGVAYPPFTESLVSLFK